MSRILVAGMGNVLRKDDGFGVEVAKMLAAGNGFPPEVHVVEVGIGGIHLVQTLMDGYDVLVVIDAADRGEAPGAVRLLEVEVPDLSGWSEEERGEFLADMHYATPSKALILSRALGVLPPRVYLLGCQVGDFTDLGIGLTEPVQRAVARAALDLQAFVMGWLHGSGTSAVSGTEGGADQERAHSE